MSSKKLYFGLLLAIVLGFFGLIGGAYAGDKVLTKKASELTGLKAQSMALERESQALVVAKKQIEKYTELEKITRTVVPEDKDQAVAVAELVKIAANNNIALASITFPASSLGATKTAPSSSSATASGTTAMAGLGSGTASNSKTADLSQLQPIRNIPGVYLLVINVQSDMNQPVAYSKFIAFLDDLEHNRRTAQVSNITISPDSEDRSKISFTLSINQYIKPVKAKS